ncbi:hypothetical protein [Pseudoroseicyclus sp. CXY001]|uniref:hypothetical protein n=1 Tax=Pseudoroseicyclus sp. CXY001 TaxID=3242492 RepID=UPI0035714993
MADLAPLLADPALAPRIAKARAAPFGMASVLLRQALVAAHGREGPGLHEALLGGPGRMARERLAEAGLLGALEAPRLFAPAARVHVPVPEGAAPGPGWEVRARALGIGLIREAKVLSAAAGIRAGGRVLIDVQEGEAGRYEVIPEADPWTWDRREGTAAMGLPPGPVEELDEALHLAGPMALAWGHSLIDFAPKLLMAARLGGPPPGAPMLIDALAPASHGALLQALAPGRPLVRVKPGRPMRVRRLWAATTPEYTPVLPAPGQRFPPEVNALNPGALAALLAGPPPLPPEPGAPRKVYYDRAPRLTRQPEAAEAIRALFVAAGYEPVLAERLEPAAQLRLAAGLTHFAGPWGSNLLMPLLFGRAQAEALILHPEALEEKALILAAAAARGRRVRVVAGAPNGPAAIPGNAAYAVPPEAVAAALGAT